MKIFYMNFKNSDFYYYVKVSFLCTISLLSSVFLIVLFIKYIIPYIGKFLNLCLYNHPLITMGILTFFIVWLVFFVLIFAISKS